VIPQDHPEWSDIGRSSRFPPGAALILSLIVSIGLLVACTTISSTRSGILQPPARYLALIDAYPYRVMERPQSSVDLFCQAALADGQVLGCAVNVRGGSCVVYILDSLSPAVRAAAIIHERGHCAGWPATHPG